MKRTKKLMVMMLMTCCLLALAACSKAPTEGQDTSITAAAPGTGEEETTDGQNQDDSTESASQASEHAEEEEKKARDVEISSKYGYSDIEKDVAILGLKEYKTIKTEKYTDKIAKDKRYLVLFLEIRNRSDEPHYFNVYSLSAKIDGKELKNTVLLNDPEGYPTIFTNIGNQTEYKGFVAWKVPKTWKKLELTYTGWKEEDALTLHSTLTKKDLKDPEDYS